jgi:hypothetical protein
MLHLVSLVAVVSIASAPAVVDATPTATKAAELSVSDGFPKLRFPFFGRKRKSDAKSDTSVVAKSEKPAKAGKAKAKPEKSKSEKPAKADRKSKAKSSKEPLALVDRRLRDLVIQQESWFAKEGRYGRDAYRIGVLRSRDSTSFVDVQV